MEIIPTFTIVTPSYNQGEFLAETIESVITQKGAFSIDYVIIDGGSTDNSVETIRRYEAQLHQGKWQINCRGITCRWLSEKDEGQTEALMKGFRQAKGNMLAWLNSDDTYLPGTLQAVADFFLDNPETGLLYGDAHYCDTTGAVIGRYRTEEFDFNKLAWFNFICQPAAFFRRDIFEEVGGLDESLHFAMDYDLWIRIGRRFPCRYLPRLLSTYRLHETSKTIRDETLFANSEEALQLAIKYFGWAPLTRVYNSCNFHCRTLLPRILSRSSLFIILATMIYTVFRSLWLNRGIRRNDLKLLNRENFGKLFKNRIDIMTGENER
jgi:glycosyltransferase involved in cell wall biosynthesis